MRVNDSFTRVTWLIHMCDMTHYDRIARRRAARDTTPTRVRRESSICSLHACVRHDLFMCVSRLIHMCDMTHIHVYHNTFIQSHAIVYRDAVLLHENHRSLLQKRPIREALFCTQDL